MNRFDIFEYEQLFAYGRCIKREGSNIVVLFETKDAYVRTIVPDYPDMVCQQFVYDAETLNLSYEGQYLKDFDIQIGVWKCYDIDGNVIEMKDMDEGYPVKWSDLKGILMTNYIKIEDIQHLSRTKDEMNKPIWMVAMKTMLGRREIIIIDAVTGRIIQRITQKIK